MAAGFAGQQPQQSQFTKPTNSNTASGSAFSSVIGSREDRGLRKSFGNCPHICVVKNYPRFACQITCC